MKKTHKYLLFGLLVVVAAYFMTAPATVIDVGEYEVGAVVNDVVQVSSGDVVDLDYSDGSITKVWGQWFLHRNGVEVNSGDLVELTSASYTHSINRAFAESGTYVHSIILVKGSNTWTASGWGSWDITTVDEQKHSFTVGYPQPPDPWSQVVNMITNFISNILGWFGLG